MTLATHVYLLTEADPADVFMKCRDLLGATDAHPWRGGEFPDYLYLTNEAGIGLPALMSVDYREGEMLQPVSNPHDEWCEEGCTYDHGPAHWVLVDFDTAYSYGDSYGGCGALHARLLFDLGGWLDDLGVQWAWRNEFTGEIHMGDKYEHLSDLIGDGQAAIRWFKGTVEPVIAALGARRG